MFRLSDLQAVEVTALPTTDEVLVEVDPNLDRFGFNRVDLCADTEQAIIDYVEIHWGGSSADPEWFQGYVVERIIEAPISFAEYRRDVAKVEASLTLDGEVADILLTRGDLRVIAESLDLLADLDEGENTDDERLRALAKYVEENLAETEARARESKEELATL